MNSHEQIDLTNASASDLLSGFLEKYNAFVNAYDELQEQLNIALSQLDGYKRQCSAHVAEIEQLNLQISKNSSCIDDLKKEQEAHESTKIRLLTIERNCTGLNAELQELRQLNPKKLKEQIARVKISSDEKDKKIVRLEREAVAYRRDIQDKQSEINLAIDKIRYEKSMALNNSAVGIYHSGDHHIVTWPQLMTIQTDDGEAKQRPLLYMHKSGRGALMTLNPATKQIHMSEAPKGGLKPPISLLEHAGMWLYNVNIMQKTQVTMNDFLVVNV